MPSSELLDLLDGLPETSKWVEAIERTFWVGEYLTEGQHKGKLIQIPAIGKPPSDVRVFATYVDWTDDRKFLARNTNEIAAMRADGRDYQPDLIVDPLQAILAERERQDRAKSAGLGQNHILAGLYGFERR